MAQTTMTRAQMLAQLAAGQSVTWKGQLITDPSQVPTDLQIEQTTEALPGTVLPSPVIVNGELIPGIIANIAATPLFTPKVSGLFKLSYYLGVTTIGTGGASTLVVTFTDDVQAQSTTINGPALNTLVPVSGSYIFRAVAGQAISFAINIANPTGNPQLQAHLVLEQLP
ncbi:MAG: hypothetical protein ACREDR_00445 [Blastocatellia bacterium]